MLSGMITGTIGGLGLFLYGMGLMSDGLKKSAGQRLKKLLESMTRRPILGFSIGVFVTALVQSSSASTVMIIGLVNAGLLTLKQAICVILGTNVGTTITAWIVSLTGLEMGAFKISHYALPAVGVGFLISIVGKTRKAKNCGQIILGFGILFIGLSFMKDAFGGLENSEVVTNWLGAMGGKPLMALLAGTLVTMVLQSSSASIAIVQLLAINGVFGQDWGVVLNIAIPFVLGGNIGTTITAQIASLGTNLTARRTAWSHTMFNVVGAAAAIPFIYLGWFAYLVEIIAPWETGPSTIAATIAVAHTLFNSINSFIFLPFAGVLERFVIWFVKAKGDEEVMEAVILEEHLLDTPVLALEQAKREIIRMAQRAKKSLLYAIEGLSSNNQKKLDKARKSEDMTDEFQYEITSYLVTLSQRRLSRDVSVELPVLLHMVNDLERVGDHAVNICEIAERKIEQKIIFGEPATDESNKMIDDLTVMFDRIIEALEKNDMYAAKQALVKERILNRMQVDLRRKHVLRMTDGECSAQSGLIFVDMVDNIEKIGDHLTNIAQSILGGLRWDKADSGTLSGEFEALLEE